MARLKNRREPEYFEVFRAIVDSTAETDIASQSAVKQQAFTRLGLTGATLLNYSVYKGRLLTTDFDLYEAALRRKMPVVNFNHIRNL